MAGHANGQSLRRLDESLQRWLGVTLRYQNAWWDKAAQTWVNESFHIIDNLTIYDQQTARRIRRNPAQTALPLSTFAWNDIVFRSFEAENLKRLDLSLYFRLSLAPSKRAYRFLDKRFYRNPLQKFDSAISHVSISASAVTIPPPRSKKSCNQPSMSWRASASWSR